MKIILTPILMLLVLLQSFTRPLIILDYTINKDYIAANLCVNKARPMMHCNGKCQLAKKLSKEDNAPVSGNNKYKYQEVHYTIQEMNPGSTITNNLPTVYFIFTSSPLTAITPDVFHPPCA